jgi:ankyrin repeat protein
MLASFPAIDVNVPQQEASRRTALHCAARCGYLAHVLTLLRSGADVTITDSEGLTAEDVTVRYGRRDVASTLARAVLRHDPSGMTVC